MSWESQIEQLDQISLKLDVTRANHISVSGLIKQTDHNKQCRWKENYLFKYFKISLTYAAMMTFFGKWRGVLGICFDHVPKNWLVL